MAQDVDAVIAALKVALSEAEGSNETFWKVRSANRWIDQLSGAWRGRWRHLKVSGDFEGDLGRKQFIAHVRATLAYLETNRDAIHAMKPWTLTLKTKPASSDQEPVDAEFEDVNPAESDEPKRIPKPQKRMRVIK